MYGSMVYARDDSLDARVQAVSVGLRAVRVAAAARRLRAGRQLTETEIMTVKSVARDLKNEARVLRNEEIPDVNDETAFAFAGLALSALPASEQHATDAMSAADMLERLAERLDQLLGPTTPSDADLEHIDHVFLRTSDIVGSDVSRTGEKVDGQFDTTR